MKDESKKSPKLAINRETVRELTGDDLKEAAGGLPTQFCTGYYPSINYPCVSVRICVA